MEYLGRYSHKVAISNHRLMRVDETGVQFTYRDYRDNRKKQMKLSGVEFLRRFSQHILPKGFVRIRHYGLLSSGKRPQLRQLQQAFGVQATEKKERKDWKQLSREHLGYDPDVCPVCRQGKMVVIQWLDGVRGPPEKLCKPQVATVK